MIALSCDPGINGAIALVCSRRGVLEYASLPTMRIDTGRDSRAKRKADARALLELLRGWSRRHELHLEDVVGVVERMQPFTRPGSAGASPVTLMSMGHTAGLVEGVLATFCRQPVLQPMPMQWKRAMRVTSDKATSQAELRRRFPGLPPVRHDIAEAILLGAWALALHDGGTVDAEPDPFAVEAA